MKSYLPPRSIDRTSRHDGLEARRLVDAGPQDDLGRGRPYGPDGQQHHQHGHARRQREHDAPAGQQCRRGTWNAANNGMVLVSGQIVRNPRVIVHACTGELKRLQHKVLGQLGHDRRAGSLWLRRRNVTRAANAVSQPARAQAGTVARKTVSSPQNALAAANTPASTGSAAALRDATQRALRVRPRRHCLVRGQLGRRVRCVRQDAWRLSKSLITSTYKVLAVHERQFVQQ